VSATAVLVTGGHGFLGRAVVEQVRSRAPEALLHVPDRDALELTGSGVDAQLREFRPSLVLHVAGRLTGTEEELRRDNDEAARRLFESCARLDPRPRIVLAGSAAVYGVGGTDEHPVDETWTPAPRGAYAETKYAAERHALGYAATGGEVVIARESNPVGPGMGDHLLCGTVARQIVAIERGDQPPVIELRDLSPVRDFLHVADAAEALWHLALHGVPGEAYNVAAGRSVVVRTMVETFLRLARVSGIEIRSTKSDVGRSPLHEQYLSIAKLNDAGWSPSRDLARAAADLLEWRRAPS